MEEFRNYAEVDPGNARLRSLISDTLDLGAWKWLWITSFTALLQTCTSF